MLLKKLNICLTTTIVPCTRQFHVSKAIQRNFLTFLLGKTRKTAKFISILQQLNTEYHDIWSFSRCRPVLPQVYKKGIVVVTWVCLDICQFLVQFKFILRKLFLKFCLTLSSFLSVLDNETVFPTRSVFVETRQMSKIPIDFPSIQLYSLT